jgi:PTH2 family peptidyl-tRNA hydrolase
MRVTEVAVDLDLKEGIDYFIIKDNCLTELEPEEVDENGIGKTTTCIGFVPLPANIASQLSKKYQLY